MCVTDGQTDGQNYDYQDRANISQYYVIHTTQKSQNLQFKFTLNRVLFKIFGALLKDSYRDICKYFGVDPIEELISVRQRKFISRYCASEGDVCRAISKLR